MSKPAAKHEEPTLTLGKVFEKMAKGKDLPQQEVSAAFGIILNDPAPTDAEIIAAMKAMIARVPTEQHFDIWNKASGERFSDVGQKYNPIDIFVAERALDAAEDLPRNRRSEAAFSILDDRTPYHHPIKEKAIRMIVKNIEHDPNAYTTATVALDHARDPKMKTALLWHAVEHIGAPMKDGHDDTFQQALECAAHAQELGKKNLLRKSCEKAVEFFHTVSEEQRPAAKEALLNIIGNDPLRKKVETELDKVTQTAQSASITTLVQKIGGLSGGPQ